MFLSKNKTIIKQLTEATAAEAHVERAHATGTRDARLITAPSSLATRAAADHTYVNIYFQSTNFRTNFYQVKAHAKGNDVKTEGIK